MIIVAPRGELRSSTNSSITCEFSLVVLLAVDGQDQRDLSMPDMPILSRKVLFIIAVFAVADGQAGLKAGEIDLTRAVVVVPDGLSPTESKAVQVLVEEVRRQSRIGWEPMIRWPTSSAPVIAVGPARLIESFPKPYRELFSLPTRRQGTGRLSHPDRRWCGRRAHGRGSRRQRCAGRALRRRAAACASFACRQVTSPCRRASTWRLRPSIPLRGHQLGYRPKTNSYDAWDLAQWERYIRDLAVFGTNAIELIPPRSDDAADSPHFPLPPLEMMAGMSQICADYGLDVWIWYPAMDADYADPEHRRARTERMGARCSRSCRGSTPSSCRAATPGTPVPRS